MRCLLIGLLCLPCLPLFAQTGTPPPSAAETRPLQGVSAASRPPVIDMHLHASTPDSHGPPPLGVCTPMTPLPHWDPGSRPWGEFFMEIHKRPPCADPVWSPATEAEMRARTLAVMETYNVIGVLSGPTRLIADWRAAAPDRIIPSGRAGFDETTLAVDAALVERVKALKEAGDLVVLGEITTQYLGISPDDARMEPFWRMAEELDIPVGIHLGTGPPGAPHIGPFPDYRARLHSALTIEEVLVRHPGLRVYLMHAGYPMLDDLLAVLMYHPQVHVDLGAIVWGIAREDFHRYLRTIVEAGFGNRVMFGSDNMVWPELVERGIQAIEDAPFLSETQKRDILYHNAARFLRLDEDEIRRHHGM